VISSGKLKFVAKDHQTFEAKARAERWARQVESEIDEGSFIPRGEAEDTTLAEALQRYQKEITPHKKGAIQECNRIDLWIKHPLSTKFLPNIRGSNMAAYRDSRVSDGKAPNPFFRAYSGLNS